MPLKPRAGGQQRGLTLPGCGSLGCWDMQGRLRSSCRGQAKSGTLGRLTCCSPKAQTCVVQLGRREVHQGGPISLVCSFGEGLVPAWLQREAEECGPALRLAAGCCHGRGEHIYCGTARSVPITAPTDWHTDPQRAGLAWAAASLPWTGVPLGGEETPGPWTALDLRTAVAPPFPHLGVPPWLNACIWAGNCKALYGFSELGQH